MLIATIGNASGRVIDQGNDHMGRWSYQKFGCKNQRTFYIISAYQVCTDHIIVNDKVKTLTATAQQTSILRKSGRDMKPRKAFVSDLKKIITELKKDGSGIMLAGDFNETLEISYDGMTKLVSDFNFKDIMWHASGRDDFATYIRGNTRIDYVVADDWISNQVVTA